MFYIDQYITIPKCIVERCINKFEAKFDTIVKYAIYYSCKNLMQGLEPYGAVSMALYYYYRGVLPSELQGILQSALEAGEISHCPKAKTVCCYSEIRNEDVREQVEYLEAHKDVLNKIYEFCFVELGKNTLAASIPYNTEDVIMTYHKFDDINNENSDIVVLETEYFLEKIEESQKSQIDENEFIRDLQSKTKEQYRHIQRSK